VEEKENNIKKDGPWWKSGIEIFGRVSTWVVAPIVLALIAGKWLDGYFNTKPWIFLTLTGIAFLFSIFGIVRTVGTYLKKIEKELWNNKNNQNK
jgi:F0F1-type ATP synthase assembly protein I